MRYRLLPVRHPETAARRRGRRVVACAGVLLASVTALVSAGTLDPSPATAAAPTARPDGTAGSAAPVRPCSKARVTAAVLSLDGSNRATTVHGDDTAYDTASIIKVDILATALLQAQDAGRTLDAHERELAEAMILHSDNASANALWREIGRAPGLEAANKRLGLTSTKGGDGFLWGLTQTTASDQIRLLRAVFDTGSASNAGPAPLDEASRAYIRTLMTHIESDQAWGVSSAAGSGWALKNGWLQRSTTGLWDINSIGQVTVNGHRYLVAVLSAGNTSMNDGIALVERTARAAVESAAGR
ncbi:serine hydrolase [Streptomyces chiangmaiensis]|uniref:Serine hydrolase n=1 Tax=Streptomyces chiangmaiensis TaxID=766497 RepID=A0ABU7FCE2_9ACTN|nr:serine hydrolase [Streptomyces chiangmaiensis]MED7821826.1 serine hydrolase [Streptomyces chiangmaiensis]